MINPGTGILSATQNGGDMLKSEYDTNKNGVVDDAEKLGGKLPAEYAKASELEQVKTDVESLNSNLTPVRINIKANISGISAYRIGRIIYVFMENMSRPAWSGGHIVEGLPNPIGKYVVAGFAGTPFTVGDGKIYADKYDANRWESFATVYMTNE